MALADLVDGQIVLDVPLREKSLIVQVPGAKVLDPDRHIWRAPLSWATCKALRGVFGNYLTLGDRLVEWAQRELDGRVSQSLYWRLLAMDPAQVVEGVDPALRPYQQTAVCFLYTAQSALLGDDMGTGKSVMSAYVLPRLGAQRVLIVAPKSMQRTWAREIEKWAGMEATLLEGSATARRKQLAAYESGALITTYDGIRLHSRQAGYGSLKLTEAQKAPKELNAVEWDVVLADEVHRAKDPKAQQTRALWALGDAAKHRLGLTGSVKTIQPDELWSLMRFVAPKEWPSRSRYLDRYCLTSFNVWGGRETLGFNQATVDELNEVLHPRLLRRPKDLVLPFLPKKVYVRRDVEMAPKQAKAYRDMADGMVAEIDGGSLMAFNPLVQRSRLSYFANGHAEIVGEEMREDGTIRQLVKLAEPSPKLDVLEEVLEELGDEPAAVFSLSRQLLDLAAVRLEKRGIPFSSVVGGMDPNQRQDAIDGFNQGAVRVILVSLGAGAEGMSLTRGSTEIFLNRGSAIQNEQAEDRMHGIGRGDQSADALTIIDLVVRDTFEEARYEAKDETSERMEDVFRDRDVLRSALLHGRKEKGRK